VDSVQFKTPHRVKIPDGIDLYGSADDRQVSQENRSWNHNAISVDEKTGIPSFKLTSKIPECKARSTIEIMVQIGIAKIAYFVFQ